MFETCLGEIKVVRLPYCNGANEQLHTQDMNTRMHQEELDVDVNACTGPYID